MSIKKKKNKVQNDIIKNDLVLGARKLNSVRSDIDRIDSRIHKLLIDRARQVEKVAKVKKTIKPEMVQAYSPIREFSILNNKVDKHKGLFPVKALVAVWREILSGYRSMQGSLTVSHLKHDKLIIRNHFGDCTNYLEFNNYNNVIIALLNKKASVAAIPFPNRQNKFWLRVAQSKTINIIGAIPFIVHKKPIFLLLSEQKMEYSSFNKIFIFLKTKKNILRKIKSYLISNNFYFNQSYNLDAEYSYVLFSTNVSSEKTIEDKINLINNEKKFNFSLKAKVIGGYAVPEKDDKNV